MLIKDIMTPHAEVINQLSTVKEAAKRMKELNVGGLPVTDGDLLIGIVTDRDITIRSTAEGLDPNKVMVQDVMSKDIEWCYEDQPVVEVEEMMKKAQIHRMPVINEQKKLVGIVSRSDFRKLYSTI